MKAHQTFNNSNSTGIFSTSDIGLNENNSKIALSLVDKLKHEYDTIMGEPDFVAVRLFSLEYPEYSVRKYK